MNTANTIAQQEKNAIAPRQQFDLSPQTFEQALTFSNYLAESDMVPKDFKGKPGNCLIAMQWGAELGLKPLQALQNLAIINGRPSLWGDAVIALVRGSPACEYVIEEDDGNTATCKVKRRGEPEQVRTFSMNDAKAAGLSGKQGPWTQYPKRMRQMRARAFALRDVFPDVLRGMPVAEEVMDTPVERHMGPVEVVEPEKKFYPDADFAQNANGWAKHVAAGKKTLDGVAAMVATKGELTAEQKAALKKMVDDMAPTDLTPKPAAGVPSTPTADTAPWDDAPAVTAEGLAERMRKAATLDELYEAANLMDALDDDARKPIENLFQERLDALKG